MSLFEFIVVMTGLGISTMGYLLLYKELRKQSKKLQQELDEAENKGNEE
jgi:hypothetical protein